MRPSEPRLLCGRAMRQVFDRAIEGFPGLADDLFVGQHHAFGCHAERMGLEDPHVGREFLLALGGAVIADGTVEILIAGVVRRLGCRVARLCNSAGVELPGAVGRSDKAPDDALQRICIAFSPKPSERLSAVSTISLSCRLRIPSLSTIAVPKLSAILSAWAASGQVRRTISRVARLRSCDTLALERLGVAGLAMSIPSLAAEAVPARAGLSFDAVDQNRQGTGGFTGLGQPNLQGRLAGKRGRPLKQAELPCAERLDRPLRGAPAALKRPAAGSNRSTEEKDSPARGDCLHRNRRAHSARQRPAPAAPSACHPRSAHVRAHRAGHRCENRRSCHSSTASPWGEPRHSDRVGIMAPRGVATSILRLGRLGHAVMPSVCWKALDLADMHRLKRSPIWVRLGFVALTSGRPAHNLPD